MIRPPLSRGAIASPRPTHRAAIVDRDGFAKLMQSIAAYEGRGSLVREALLMLALTAARPGELRLAQWEEFDLEAGVWTVPESRMKMRKPHRAPLPRQTLDILRRLKSEDVKARPPSPLVFPSARPLSENAFNVALRTMGFAKEEVSAHGFCSSFSTLANESGLWSYDAIERALAHQDGSEVGDRFPFPASVLDSATRSGGQDWPLAAIGCDREAIIDDAARSQHSPP